MQAGRTGCLSFASIAPETSAGPVRALVFRSFGGLGSPDRSPAVLGDQGALSGEEQDWGLCVEPLENGWEAAWLSEGRFWLSAETP